MTTYNLRIYNKIKNISSFCKFFFLQCKMRWFEAEKKTFYKFPCTSFPFFILFYIYIHIYTHIYINFFFKVKSGVQEQTTSYPWHMVHICLDAICDANPHTKYIKNTLPQNNYQTCGSMPVFIVNTYAKIYISFAARLKFNFPTNKFISSQL